MSRPERWLSYREAREILRNLLSHSDAKAAILIVYRDTGGNRRMSRAAVMQIADSVKIANEKARGDRDRQSFSKQSPLWCVE